MSRNVKNVGKFSLAVLATIGLLHFFSQTPMKYYDWIGVVACLGVWVWYFIHVIKDGETPESKTTDQQKAK